jgi:SAM-dependent methyltransferase
MGLHETHERPFTWRHRLPRGRPRYRHDVIVELARGCRVIHLGFVDELLEEKVAGGVWLHDRLAEAATSLVGLDLSERGVEWAKEHGHEAHVVDAQDADAVAALGLEPADLLVAGEIIEHLDAPGPFLRAVRQLARPEGRIVLTTPNAYRLLNFLAPLSGSELVHPDHTAWHSPRTLRTLLERSGWEVEEVTWYVNPPREGGGLANVARRVTGALNRILPFWSDGIVAVARPRA